MSIIYKYKYEYRIYIYQFIQSSNKLYKIILIPPIFLILQIIQKEYNTSKYN